MSAFLNSDKVGEHAPSLYAASCDTPAHPVLCDDIITDVCIIGAGYTGLSAALHCAHQGLSVVVLDAHRVGWGASGRNGGQLGSGFNMAQSTMEKKLGIARAKSLWNIAQSAKATIHQLCSEHHIDIEYHPGIISAFHRPRYVKAAHEYAHSLARDYGYDELEVLSKEQIRQHIDSPVYYGGVLDHGAGHIHPLKLAYGLAKQASCANNGTGARIFEKSQVLSIETTSNGEELVRTDSGSVLAKNLVLACNGYAGSLDARIQQRVMPINNFIVATEPLGDAAQALIPQRRAVFDSRFVVNYFRITRDNRLLFGGGETYRYQFPSDIRRVVSKPLTHVFPQLKGIELEYAWGGTLAITRSRLPLVVKLDNSRYSASGYSGHGVALAVESGKAIAEAIGGDTTNFNTLKDLPCPQFPGGALARPALLAGAMTWYSLLDRF